MTITISDIHSAIQAFTAQNKQTCIAYQFLNNCIQEDFEFSLDKYRKTNGDKYCDINAIIKCMNNDIGKTGIVMKVRDVYDLFGKPYPNMNNSIMCSGLKDLYLVRHDELIYDRHIFQDIIKPYTICQKTKGCQYPSFIIYTPGAKSPYFLYNIYRYFAQLPAFASLSHTKKLPTVDHINRNKLDSRLENLRYCTAKQNTANSCKLNTNKYHGITKGNQLSIKDIIGKEKIVVWTSIFDHFLEKHPNYKTDHQHLIYIDIHDACPNTIDHLHEFKDKIYIMDLFIDGFLKLKDSEYQYSKETKISDIPIEEYQHIPFLKMIVSNINHHHKVYKIAFKHDYIAALAFDIDRYSKYGEFAHMNFIKSKQRITHIRLNNTILSPIDILNLFEKEYDQKFLAENAVKQGLSQYRCYKKYRLDNGIIIADSVCKEDIISNNHTSCLWCYKEGCCDPCDMDNLCYIGGEEYDGHDGKENTSHDIYSYIDVQSAILKYYSSDTLNINTKLLRNSIDISGGLPISSVVGTTQSEDNPIGCLNNDDTISNQRNQVPTPKKQRIIVEGNDHSLQYAGKLLNKIIPLEKNPFKQMCLEVIVDLLQEVVQEKQNKKS